MRKMLHRDWDALWINASLVTMDETSGTIQSGAIASKDGKIAWLGAVTDLTDAPEQLATTVHDVQGRCITPGLIDCHTHLVYAGNRCNEFELRLQGATYETIAREGGGIQSTVRATRVASEEELLRQSLRRAQALLATGVTTVEIKSGYGLDLETEMKILRVAKRIGEMLPLTVSLTFLGAHALPPEYKSDPDRYIDVVCKEMLPRLVEEGLVNAVDVFCDKIAFNVAQCERVFQAAQEFGLAVKCHAEQLSDIGASRLAAKYEAVSVDHLEFLSADGVEALAEAGSVAVLLPGAFYFLRETRMPPVELLRRAGVPMAVATDCNPGTSPVTSLLLMLNMACTLFRLTPDEALMGATRNAARALGLEKKLGTLALGMEADFVVWDAGHAAELAYYIGMNPCGRIIKAGETVQLHGHQVMF